MDKIENKSGEKVLKNKAGQKANKKIALDALKNFGSSVKSVGHSSSK